MLLNSESRPTSSTFPLLLFSLNYSTFRALRQLAPDLNLNMPFQFVDNNAPIGRAARKNIRSHVAIGKNAGKTLVRRSRTKAFVLKPHIPSTFEIPCQIGDGLSGICIPTTLSPRFRPIVQKCMLGQPTNDAGNQYRS